ncbi:MAG: type III-B CRISPR module RAMP protein Cmr4 [Methanosarcinaceae archaeon]
MFLKQKPLFLWVETPLHAGSGSDLGIVDLPIQREKHTGFPKIEASGIKGCLRESFENKLERENTELNLAFGPESANESHAGALGFSDARLLLFPVKSVKGVFAWITCPQILVRFKRELELCGAIKENNGFDIPEKETAPKKCGLFVKKDKIVLEEYTFSVTKDGENGEDSATTMFAKWLKDNVANNMEQFWKDKIEKDVLVLSDEDFKDFVTMSTEVIARTKIDDYTGTVAKGALWYEEYLPVDSILYSIVFSGPVFEKKEEKKGEFRVDDSEINNDIKRTEAETEKVMNFFTENLDPILQIGGNATIGKGFVRTVFLNGKKEEAQNAE